MAQAPTLEYLMTMTANLRANTPVIAHGPQGTRAIAIVTGGTFEGPKLRGTLDDSGGDWVTVRADGSIKLDVRVLLHTHDGADIFMRYEGVGLRQDDGSVNLATAPLFETGDERYAWLNHVQAITSGKSKGGVVTYEVFGVQL
ncbi:MAG: DUF3237 domain-containing protein [Dehalococcoidia bacterium]|nr:DUF3237 domain-containing protein [Dehalococcoidia bacterium]